MVFLRWGVGVSCWNPNAHYAPAHDPTQIFGWRSWVDYWYFWHHLHIVHIAPAILLWKRAQSDNMHRKVAWLPGLKCFPVCRLGLICQPWGLSTSDNINNNNNNSDNNNNTKRYSMSLKAFLLPLQHQNSLTYVRYSYIPVFMCSGIISFGQIDFKEHLLNAPRGKKWVGRESRK